ncbi:biotin/lipoyl-containing protein [Roseovarius sp.]|uniref:biotin/lipoyl-containing protein n=1 Tax=Roseovarius sp. TaxID=1486281 RepID=UPI003569C140
MSFRILIDGEEHQIDIVARRPHLVVAIDGRRITVADPGSEGDGLDRLTIEGADMAVARAQTATGLILRTEGRTFHADLLAEGEDAAAASGDLHAPMPGAVVGIEAAVGDSVESGDPIVTIESMKLQMVLAAPRAGVVAEILVSVGEGFEKDQLLARLADDNESEANA